MKKTIRGIVVGALSLGLVCAFAGCGASPLTITTEPNVAVSKGISENVGAYDPIAYYYQEKNEDVAIRFETDKIQKVSYKYRVLSGDEYTFKNKTLTVKSSVFEGETSGDKRLRVFVDNQYVEITLRVVTKIIYTTDDFNAIRNNLNGVYVLGADIDFANEAFWPIGKSVSSSESTGIFEGIFDGKGHAVKNITINAHDYAEGENKYYEEGVLVEIQGPSLGSQGDNGRNYNNGIFMQTSGNSQIINTDFVNITVKTQGLGGAVAGLNGGLIKNCRVSCSLTSYGYSERMGGIAGINGSTDAPGKIENCIVLYDWNGSNPARGFADWNNGTIKNSYAALVSDYVYHMGYNSETGKIAPDFDYDEFITQENFLTYGFGWYTTPALPGAASWVNGVLTYYKGGDIINSDVVRKETLLDPANFAESDGWDTSIWNFTYGAFPTLKLQNI